MKNLDQLAVYCGSAPGSDPAFADATRATAAAMVRERIQLVYGGGRLGLMGLIADSVLELGGEVYGVIPQALVDIEVAHPSVTEVPELAPDAPGSIGVAPLPGAPVPPDDRR